MLLSCLLFETTLVQQLQASEMFVSKTADDEIWVMWLFFHPISLITAEHVSNPSEYPTRGIEGP